MANIQWNDDLSVGVKLIDSQHKALIAIANRVIEAVELGQGQAAINGHIQKLREYTVFHFNSEEKLMDRIRYPKRGEQASEHARLKREVKYFQRQIYQKDNITPVEIRDFVINWFFGHILTHDSDLAKFIHAREEAENKR